VSSTLRRLQNLWAGIVIAVLVPILVCRVIGAITGLIWTRRRTRSTFRRSLLNAGMSADEADALTIRYHTRISFRELLRQRHRFGH